MYKDRGIIKWAPFDALKGFSEAIYNYQYNKGKKAKPVILEDQLEIMDYTIKKAINNNLEVMIYYYSDGYIKNFYSYVKKVDIIKRVISFDNNVKLKIEGIIDVKLL